MSPVSRIGLSKNTPQYDVFLFVAHHFGLAESDFSFLGSDDASADVAFASEEADAVFRVRALHNAAITALSVGGEVRFIPIEDATAMQIEAPAFTPAVIPKGAYLGNPPVPSAELPTVSADHMLLARADVDDEVITEITRTLMEKRQELAAAIPETEAAIRPLLAEVKQPDSRLGLADAIHPGAMAYYDRFKPSFVQVSCDLLAFLLLFFAMIPARRSARTGTTRGLWTCWKRRRQGFPIPS